MSEQLWSDDEIDAELITIGYSRADSIMRRMRDEYEAELARLREENERLRVRSDALRARMRKACAILELMYRGALVNEVIELLAYTPAGNASPQEQEASE